LTLVLEYLYNLDEIPLLAVGEAAPMLLEYQALVQRRANYDIEIGSGLFRDWAFEEGKIKKPFASRPAFAGDGEFPPGYYQNDVAIWGGKKIELDTSIR
jgi:hypothetical protein